MKFFIMVTEILTNLLLPGLQSNVIDHWSLLRLLLLFCKMTNRTYSPISLDKIDSKPFGDRGVAAR